MIALLLIIGVFKTCSENVQKGDIFNPLDHPTIEKLLELNNSS
jgi:hypothetical protein